MSTKLELAYILNKHVEDDWFESEFPVEIPIQGQIRLKDAAGMDLAAANAVMGLQIFEGPGQTILRFARRSQIPNITFPGVSEDSNKFRKLGFRILTSAQDNGQETNFAIAYEINNDECRVVAGNASLGANWLALVTVDQNDDFELLYRKEDGPGGGDPCDVWDCENTTNVAVKIKCILNGCSTHF